MKDIRIIIKNTVLLDEYRKFAKKINAYKK